jgi:hypothetical protein
MLAQYGPGTPDFLFRAHFLLKLPASIREHLHQDTADLHELAKKADHQWALMKSSVSSMASSEENISAVRRDSFPRRGGAQNEKKKNANSSPFCFYHRRFGNKAARCLPPCAFKDEAKSGNGLADRQ